MERNKQRIINSFNELIQRKPLEKITIAEICNEAFMSRPTFYHYFKDKFDLVNSIFDDLFNSTVLTISNSNDWHIKLNSFLHGLENQEAIFSACYKYGGQNSLSEHHTIRVYEFYLHNFEARKGRHLTDEENFKLKVFCCGGAYMTAEWVRNGCKESCEWMTDQLEACIPDMIREQLEN